MDIQNKYYQEGRRKNQYISKGESVEAEKKRHSRTSKSRKEAQKNKNQGRQALFSLFRHFPFLPTWIT
jgi:hypothetical protein